MSKKPKKRSWRVTGYGKQGMYPARYPRSAMSQFMKQYQSQLQVKKGAVRGIHGLHAAPCLRRKP